MNQNYPGIVNGGMADDPPPDKCSCVPRCPSENCTGCCPCCRRAGRKQNERPLISNDDLIAELEAAAGVWVLNKNKYTLESLRDARKAVLKRMQAPDETSELHFSLPRSEAGALAHCIFETEGSSPNPSLGLRKVYDLCLRSAQNAVANT